MYIEAERFEDLYIDSLETVLKCPDFTVNDKDGKLSMLEQYGLLLRLNDPYSNVTELKTRGFKLDFAEKFFQWNWTGQTDVSKLIPANANAKPYHDENYGRNTAYGPRILAQLPSVLEELKSDVNSRRGVILILDADDRSILADKQSGKTTIEYPCTDSITFSIRDLKLHAHVHMRSNNLTTTICYDFYNFTRMMQEVLALLKVDAYPSLELGFYSHSIVSAHVLGHEVDLAKDIVNEFYAR